MFKRVLPSIILAALAVGFIAESTFAEVTRVEVKTRSDIGTSGFEKIVGIVHFAVDPKNPKNSPIADLNKAPANAQGQVEFSSDFYIIRPKDAAKSNGIALVEVLNRGRKLVVS